MWERKGSYGEKKTEVTSLAFDESKRMETKPTPKKSEREVSIWKVDGNLPLGSFVEQRSYTTKS